MIKIVKGVYGHKDINGHIVPKTPKSGAFSASAEAEDRLVEAGIAVKVEDQDPICEEPEEGQEEHKEKLQEQEKKAAKKPEKKAKRQEKAEEGDQPDLSPADPE